MSVKQNTLKGEFSLKGKGLHTGKEVCATFKPAAENTGYQVVRTDLEDKPVLPLSRQRKIPDIKLSESISKRKPRFRHWRNILNW